MFYKSVLLVLGVSYWLCSVVNSGGTHEDQSILPGISPLIGSHLDCSRFKNDFDVLRHFPFPVLILPEDKIDFQTSSAYLHQDGNTIKDIYIRHGTIVPPHVFCLSNLSGLNVFSTPFPSGNVVYYSRREFDFLCIVFRSCS